MTEPDWKSKYSEVIDKFSDSVDKRSDLLDKYIEVCESHGRLKKVLSQIASLHASRLDEVPMMAKDALEASSKLPSR